MRLNSASNFATIRSCSASGGTGIWKLLRFVLLTSLKVVELLSASISLVKWTRAWHRNLSMIDGLQMKFVNPWLVANSLPAIASFPIVARVENTTAPLGKSRAELFSKPSCVIFLVESEISEMTPILGRSVGLNQITSFPQKSGLLVLGVPPPIILAVLFSSFHSHPCGSSYNSCAMIMRG